MAKASHIPSRVVIIGGGPAGLTAAHDLALKGYHVTVFESGPVLGGMMRWGYITLNPMLIIPWIFTWTNRI